MTRYHLTAKGEPGLCRAREGGCPFSDDDDHYPSATEARQAYEFQQQSWQRPRSLSSGTRLQTLMVKRGAVAAENIRRRPERMATVDEFKTAADEISRKHQIRTGTEGHRNPHIDHEAFEQNWRRDVLDSLEDRGGERWDNDVEVTLFEPTNDSEGFVTNRADDWGLLPPGEYVGTVRDLDGKQSLAIVAVYDDRVSRAFREDLRDNEEYRRETALATRAPVAKLAEELRRMAQTELVTDLRARREQAATLLRTADENVDWDNPQQVVALLELVEEMEDQARERQMELEANGKLSKDLEERYDAFTNQLSRIQDQAYYLQGRAKLAPIKNA